MKKMLLLKTTVLCAGVLLSAAACGDDPGDFPPPVTLATPAVTRAAEKSANPFVLEFAWSEVENASGYEYKLQAGTETGATLVVSGTIQAAEIEIAASGSITILPETSYTFSVRALSGDATRFLDSGYDSQTVGTSPSDFRLTISDLTYRSADMLCVPADPKMRYFFAQIILERYQEYPNDNDFFENFEKDYYKVVAQQMGAPWYMYMESKATKGESGYYTGALIPETDYFIYAYGIKAMVEEFDIAMITPIVKLPFRTPAWKATIDCTFDITPIEVSSSRIALDVEPAKKDVSYYFALIPASSAEQEYDNDMAAVTRNILYLQDAINKVNWADTDLLLTGDITFSLDAGQVATLDPGVKYLALAFGVDKRGLQTTELSMIEFYTPAASASSVRRSQPTPANGLAPQFRAERMTVR